MSQRKKPRGNRKAPKVKFRRRDTEFAGLQRELHPKTRWEYLDMDYIDELSHEEKAILSKFIDEYYGASLAPAHESERWQEDFHSTPELRKECMDRNNARNRDLYTILRTRGMIGISPDTSEDKALDQITEDSLSQEVVHHFQDHNKMLGHNDMEDTLIEAIDLTSQNKLEASLKDQTLQDQQQSPQEPQE